MTIMFYLPLRHMRVGVWIIYSLYLQDANIVILRKVYQMQHYLSARILFKIFGGACMQC